MFLEKGFQKTTIGDIASACELTSGAIYLYFKNKDVLILTVMTKISRKFGDLLSEADSDGGNGAERVSRILNIYNHTFRIFRNYHMLDAEFNALFTESYPDSPLTEKYFKANKQVLDILTAAFELGLEDGSLHYRRSGETEAQNMARMLLNSLNSYVEKISLRKNLMEKEQGILMEDELKYYTGFLIDSLKSAD